MLKISFIPKSELVHSSTRVDLGLEVIKSVDAKNVLVLCPHPDDETFGCGGLLKHLSGGGAKIKVIYFVNGAVGNKEGKKDYDLVTRREEEASLALKVLGSNEVNFLRVEDDKMVFSDQFTDFILEELKIREYDLVLIPSADDWNKDHRVLNLIFKTAYKKLKNEKLEVWEYFVWGISAPSYLFPIDDYLCYKTEAAHCHKSQLKVKAYDEAFLALNEYLGKGFVVGKHAEAYRRLNL